MKPQIIQRFFLSSAFIFIISTYLYSVDLKPAYKFAGKNRSELETVIKHYSVNPSDSLKRKAAMFLIENMPAHYTYYSYNWDLLSKSLSLPSLQQLTGADYISCYDSIFDAFEHKLNDYILKYDKDTIKSSYLIENIDNAFKLYKQPQCKYLKFQDFCEYVLPYKIGNENFTNWRNYFHKKYYPLYASIYKRKGDSVSYYFCDTLKRIIKPQIHAHYPASDIDPLTIEKLKVGSCFEFARLISSICMSVGIPVSIDYTPNWGKKGGSHEWNALLTPNKKPLDFGAGDNDKLGYHLKSNEVLSLWIAPKIYRRTYSINKDGLAYLHGSEEIPDILNDSCFIDVTSEYYKTVNIETEIRSNIQKRKYAYLAVSNRDEWQPIHWAEIKNEKAEFCNMNKNIMYLPCYYFNGRTLPAAYPIAYKDSVTKIELKPDIDKKQTLKLTRKFYNPNVSIYNRRLKSSKFQVASKSDFSDAKDIYVIGNCPTNNYQTIVLDSLKAYKYFRYFIPKAVGSEMAEIELFDPNNNKLSGKLIYDKDCNKPEVLFDNSTLTYMKVGRSKDTWVGLEFSKMEQIKKVKYLPRNDDNFIREGENYELFYWDNQWVSLGKQIGTQETQTLTYDNSPTNALFILRNLTKGREERIFTYEKGKQVWW